MWGDIKRGLKRGNSDEEMADEEYVDEEFQSTAYLHDILGAIEAGIQEQREFNSQTLELLDGIVTKLAAIEAKTPAFHEGVEKALELSRNEAERQEAIAADDSVKFE
jgi:hypothetical protein